MADSSSYPGTPRWVKVFGIIGIAVLVLFLSMMHARGSSHARHTFGDDLRGHSPALGVTERNRPAGADR